VWLVRRSGDIYERLALGAERHDTGCWLWIGALSPKGYGLVQYRGRQRRAHRVSYEVNVGPIPHGLVLDHLCRVRRCINPDHLEAVTIQENLARGLSFSAVNAQKTECVAGHPLSGENLIVASYGRGIERVCRECRRRRRRKSMRTLKAKRRAAKRPDHPSSSTPSEGEEHV
jgi:hypothetical protein